MRRWSTHGGGGRGILGQIHVDPTEVEVRKRVVQRSFDVTPSASRLTESLRDIGYDFPSAIADLVDNSVSAGARWVDVIVAFDGPNSYVLVADDGRGMTDAKLTEALRFGTRREYESGELGRYGLGLKTASVSQCRRVTVATRRAPERRRLALRTLDLDHVIRTDRWEVTDPPHDSVCYRCLEWLNDAPGTVVFWEGLDRVLPERRSEGGWARRRLEHLSARTAEHLGMVFHRFLEGEAGGERLTIAVNGEKVRPWNPFAPGEEAVVRLPERTFELVVGNVAGTVRYRPYVLPPRSRFSNQAEFERLSGQRKWNRQQGLYLYRADRMVKSGGWCGIRAADEHTKLARAALDFPTDLDRLFRINVSKMQVLPPPELRQLLERSVQEVCHAAEVVYRREAKLNGRRKGAGAKSDLVTTGNANDLATTLLAVALEVGEHEAFGRIMARVREAFPEVAEALGW
jgi:hypothetical protein